MKLPRFALISGRTIALGIVTAYLISTEAQTADATCWVCRPNGLCISAGIDTGIIGCSVGDGTCDEILGDCSVE